MNSCNAHEVPVPPRDWKKYGVAYVLHGVQGAVCGYLLKRNPKVSLTGTGLYMGYQTLEMWRRKDTPARDVKDFSVCWAAGVVASELLDWYVSRKK